MKSHPILALLQKEFLLEWRQKYALNGILLYVVGTVFICYLSFSGRGNSIGIPTWNALYWIILLFSALHAISKSFIQERTGRTLYYYSLASPLHIILAKLIYNSLLMLLLSFFALMVYVTVLGNPIGDLTLFLITLLLGSLGFAGAFTLLSGIVSKAGNNATLMAILSFPVILPFLLMVMKLSKNAIDGLDRTSSFDEILVLISLNAITFALSLLLFPFLWRS